MRSTMQETPLSLATLVRYGTTVHGSAEVVTWTGDGARTATYAEVGRRAAQLAHGLRELGITGDDRVGTFMWNNQEHLEAYLAVPAMGAVLHPLNIRLFPDQLAYIANHAADKVIIVDGSVLPVLAKVLGQLSTVEHLVVNGPADLSVIEGTHATVHAYDELLAGRPEDFDWVVLEDETSAAAMCYTSGTTGNPKGVVYSHRSIYLHSMQVCMPDGFGLSQADRLLLIVPMFHVLAWGTPYAAMMCGATMVMPDRFLAPEPLAELIETTKPTLAGGVPTIWAGLLAHLDEHPRDMSSLRDAVVGGSAAPRALIEGLERHGIAPHPRLGDDRDVAARVHLAAAGGRRGRGAVALPPHPGPARGRRSRPGWSGRTAPRCREDGAAVGRARGARAVDHRRRTSATTTPASSTTAGCAPATSAASRPTASSPSPTGPRTSSSPAASGSRRSSWRTP